MQPETVSRVDPAAVGRFERAVMELDLEALRVVSQWQFSPTIVGGTAVAVIVTVTVKFTLQ